MAEGIIPEEGTVLSRISAAYQSYSEFEDSLERLVARNSSLIEHIVENWQSALAPGFWAKVVRHRLKARAMQRLTSRCMRSILHPNTGFVMNVTVIRTWKDEHQSFITKFDDSEIILLYRTILALDYDADFVTPLNESNPLLIELFRDKVPYIRRNLRFFQGDSIDGPIEYPRLISVSLKDQREVNGAIGAAANLSWPARLTT